MTKPRFGTRASPKRAPLPRRISRIVQYTAFTARPPPSRTGQTAFRERAWGVPRVSAALDIGVDTLRARLMEEEPKPDRRQVPSPTMKEPSPDSRPVSVSRSRPALALAATPATMTPTPVSTSILVVVNSWSRCSMTNGMMVPSEDEMPRTIPKLSASPTRAIPRPKRAVPAPHIIP